MTGPRLLVLDVETAPLLGSRKGPKPKPPAERFWPKVEKGDGCWTWQAARDRRGYGKFGVGGRSAWVFAHRFSFELTHGPIPEGAYVLHRCDNPPCVNPSHLFLGTAAVNAADMVAKGRSRGQRVEVCHRGHDLSLAYKYGTKRVCRECKHIEYLTRRKAAAK